MIASCFHEDATDDHGMYKGDGRGFARYVMEGAGSMISTVHSVSNITIELDGDTARSEAYVYVVMRMPSGEGGAADHVIHGRYLDRFERRDRGPWLIAHRVVAYDLTRIDPVGREWGLGDGYTVGRRDRSDPSYRTP
jgi:ketosteroid isomerase-like protein